MTNDVGPLQGQGTGRFGVVPIETNHHADLRHADIPHLKSAITRREEQGFFIKQMCFAIAAEKPGWSHDDRRVVAV